MAKQIVNPWRRVWSRAKNIWRRDATPKNLFTLAGGIFLLTGVISGVMISVSRFHDANVAPRKPEGISTVISTMPRHPLTGEALSAPLSVLPQVFGIMIENSADAWPLSGVDQAFLVIEAPVEGSIPRFIAFFSEDQDVKKIGPVRSARPYYLDWNAEFNGIYGHVGGSPEALNDIAKTGTLDLNQFFQDEYYYRDEITRYAPHNVYTTIENLKKAKLEIDEKYSDSATPKYDSWVFTDGATSTAAPSATTIHLDWSSSPGYNVDWFYSGTTNMYTRKQGGNSYTVSNVVMVETSVDVISGDDKGRKELQTIGSGVMHLFHDGIEIVGTWKKPSAEERLRFYEATGNEIVMNAGKTWIEILDTLDRLSVTEHIVD